MATAHAPERQATKRGGAARRLEKGASKRVGRFLARNARPALAVTAGQLAIVEAARSWRRRFNAWPTAAELAHAAEFTRPDVWSALKALERIGVVRWRRRVEVVRVPDGVFFVPEPSQAPPALYFPAQGAAP
jgi:hypothetical protein